MTKILGRPLPFGLPCIAETLPHHVVYGLEVLPIGEILNLADFVEVTELDDCLLLRLLLVTAVFLLLQLGLKDIALLPDAPGILILVPTT